MKPTTRDRTNRMQGNLNSSNRPVRTRMPGGVGGARSKTAPYPDLRGWGTLFLRAFIVFAIRAVFLANEQAVILDAGAFVFQKAGNGLSQAGMA